MGPDQNTLERVKEDAIRGTLRHFRHAQEDNGFKPVGPMDYETVRADLLDKREEKETEAAPEEESKATEGEEEVSKPKGRPKKEASNG